MPVAGAQNVRTEGHEGVRLCGTVFRRGNENLGVRSLAVRPRHSEGAAQDGGGAVTPGAWCAA